MKELSIPTSGAEVLAALRLSSLWGGGEAASDGGSTGLALAIKSAVGGGVVLAVSGALAAATMCAVAIRRAGGTSDVSRVFKEISAFGAAGRFVFSRVLIANAVPFAASLRTNFLRLDADFVEATVAQRRALQNPFSSIHLGALIVAGETTQGCGILSQLAQSRRRAIPVRQRSEFYKKARGTVTFRFEGHVPTDAEEYEGETVVLDAANAVVAKVWVTWAISAPRLADNNN